MHPRFNFKRRAETARRTAANLKPPFSRIFVSADVEVAEGEAAEELLKKKNDARFLREPEKGILKVDRTRWKEAQRYERRTWMDLNQTLADDRNEHHRKEFGGYKALRGRRFDRAIELGCGPFTNARLILKRADVGSIDLLDPLINDYLDHPHCTYRDGELAGRPVGALHHTSIEDFSPTLGYDLVIMINVLEHCFDAEAIFEKVLQMTNPGGYFVFHDKLYTKAFIKPTRMYDAGHPLRIRGKVTERFLHDNFTTVYEKHVIEPSMGVLMTYFIGEKRT